MCGIFGYLSTSLLNVNDSILNGVLHSQSHRGPDSQGVYSDQYAYIGMNRLAIIDLQSGAQPIFNEDKSKFIVYNGELYNYRSLRKELSSLGHIFTTKTDTEVVLHAYEEYGSACLAKFNGMFAFSIYDINTRELFIARDRLGIKPLYYSQRQDIFAFASEASTLTDLMPEVAPDWDGISKYLHFGYVPFSHSPFAGILKLPPGSFAFLNDGELSIEQYWEPEYEPCEEGISFAEACDNVDKLLEECMQAESMSDVPLGLFLSGGLDSAAVGYYMNRTSPRKVRSFGIEFAEATHDESKDSQLLAQHLNIEHTNVFFGPEQLKKSFIDVFNHIDEPFADATTLPLYHLAKETRKDLKVVLTGWGGDELFAGYPTLSAHKYSAYLRKLPSFVLQDILPWMVKKIPPSDSYMGLEFKAKRFIRGVELSPELQHFAWMGYFDMENTSSLFVPEISQKIHENSKEHIQGFIDSSLNESCAYSRIMHLDNRFFLPGNGLFQADRMSMATSLEARVPLLNSKLYDYVNKLPMKIKMHYGKPKELLRSVLRPHLPERIINKPKKGFGPPVANWTKRELRGVFERLFSSKQINQSGIFVADKIKKLYDDHVSCKADNGRELWALLSFQLWYERHINKKRIEELDLL